MTIGSDNEQSVISGIENTQWLVCFYEIGLVGSKWDPYFAVSPDGMAVIKVNNKEVIATVEIKSRVAVETIAFAMRAAKKHGKLVICAYNGEFFNEYLN